MVEGGQIVLKARQLIQPVATDQIRPGGKSLPNLDEAGAEVRQRAQQGASQIALNAWVTASAAQQQAQHQTQKGPEDLDQARDADPGAQQKPSDITARVVAKRIHAQQC